MMSSWSAWALTYTVRGWEIAQLVKHLPCKHKDPSSISRTPFRKLGIGLEACNPISGGGVRWIGYQDAGRPVSLAKWAPGHWDPVSKEKSRWTATEEWYPRLTPDLHMCIPMCVHVLTHKPRKRKTRIPIWFVSLKTVQTIRKHFFEVENWVKPLLKTRPVNGRSKAALKGAKESWNS